LEHGAKVQIFVLQTKKTVSYFTGLWIMAKNTDVSERFLEAYSWLIENNKVEDRKSFLQRIGVSSSYLTEIVKGRSSVGLSAIQKIVSEFGISSDWILTGNGSIQNSVTYKAAPIVKEEPAIYGHRTKNGLPYYDVDFLGGFNEVFNDQTTTPAYYIDLRPFIHADFWCNLSGDSMSPRLNNGDIIALKRCALETIQYGEIYAVVMGELRTVKIIRKGKDECHLRFIPINLENYDEQEYHVSEIIGIFKVVGSIRPSL
jgi:hypothetical protein